MEPVSRRRLALFSAAVAALVLVGGLLLAPSSAQRQVLSMDDVIATGKGQLFQKTVPSILQAYSTFRNAAADPSYTSSTTDQKIKIRAYLAFTRLLDAALRTDGQETDTLTKLLARYGVMRKGTDLETLKFDLPQNNTGKIVLPSGVPSSETVRAFLAGPFLDAVNASIADLDTAISLCGTGKGTEIIAKNLISPTHDLDVEVDIGEYRLFRAGLKALKALALLVSAYNLDLNVQELAGLINSDALNLKVLLDRYPQLLNLLTTGWTPAYNGSAKLAEAKTALIGAIDDYTAASEKIRTDKTVTPGAEKLVSIEDEQLMKERFFREEMGKVRTALQGNAVYEFVGDEEIWHFTETATGRIIKIVLDHRKSDGWASTYNYSAPNLFVGYARSLKYTLLNNADLTVRISTNGVYNNAWFGAAEFRGVLSDDGTLLTGTYRTGLSSQSWEQMTARGEFTAQLASTETDKVHVNPSAILGNGTTAPNLRDFLPEFTAYGLGVPRIGTMGHGLGNDATLNNLLPDMTQKTWARDIDILGYSGPVNIPAVSDGKIVVDGLVGDWTGIDPVCDHSAYAMTEGVPGRHISKLFLAQDSANLYARMDTVGNRQDSNGFYDYAVRFTTNPGGEGQEISGDKRLYAAYRGLKSTWTFATDAAPLTTPSKTLTVGLWGANASGYYSYGSGDFTGPAGDPVFPQSATLQWGSIGKDWMGNSTIYLHFGTFTFRGYLNTAQDQISGGIYEVQPLGPAYGSFTGVRSGQAPFWQTYLATYSNNQWISAYLGDNQSMGIGANVEWKAPLNQLGSVAGMYLQPETTVWSQGYNNQGERISAALQIGPASAAQTLTGTLTVPGYDGKGIVTVGVYLSGSSATPENRIAQLVLYPGQYNPGMTYTLSGIPARRLVYVVATWDRNNLGFVGPGVYRNVYANFMAAPGTKTLNVSASKGHTGFPAPTFNGVFAQRIFVANTGLYTYQLTAFVSGPSPEDVAVTVQGPSGQTYDLKAAKFNLGLPTSRAGKGLSYEFVSNTPLPQGNYVFEAVDILGRRISATRNLTYGNLPALDPSKLLPGAYATTGFFTAYGGTPTPTLSWVVPANIPAGCQWMVFVRDWHTGHALFKSDPLPATTGSYTLPPGYLQADTTYNWSVGLWDGQFANGSFAGNLLITSAYSATPALTWAYMVTLTTASSGYYVYHDQVIIPFGIAVLPGEILSARLKNDQGTVLVEAPGSAIQQNTRLFNAKFYQFGYIIFTPPPEGSYTVEATLNRPGNPVVKSQPIPYSFKAVQPIDALSLNPDPNAYFDTTTPTFSWTKTSDPNAWYHVRIYHPVLATTSGPDVEFYRGPWLQDSSWTAPAGVLKPGMTYRWRLCTASDYDPQGSPITGPWHSFSFANAGNAFTINAYYLKGDLNNDGRVDLYDGLLALQVGSGTIPPALRPDYVPSGIDVNGDNKVGLAEVLYILQHAATVR